MKLASQPLYEKIQRSLKKEYFFNLINCHSCWLYNYNISYSQTDIWQIIVCALFTSYYCLWIKNIIVHLSGFLMQYSYTHSISFHCKDLMTDGKTMARTTVLCDRRVKSLLGLFMDILLRACATKKEAAHLLSGWLLASKL